MSTLRQETGAVGALTPAYRSQSVPTWDETKSSLKTTELLVLLATIIGVIIVARASDYLDTQWATGFVTALSIGYLLSRGLAKSSSSHREVEQGD